MNYFFSDNLSRYVHNSIGTLKTLVIMIFTLFSWWHIFCSFTFISQNFRLISYSFQTFFTKFQVDFMVFHTHFMLFLAIFRHFSVKMPFFGEKGHFIPYLYHIGCRDIVFWFFPERLGNVFSMLLEGGKWPTTSRLKKKTCFNELNIKKRNHARMFGRHRRTLLQKRKRSVKHCVISSVDDAKGGTVMRN